MSCDCELAVFSVCGMIVPVLIIGKKMGANIVLWYTEFQVGNKINVNVQAIRRAHARTWKIQAGSSWFTRLAARELER